jgi:hypothetical protein
MKNKDKNKGRFLGKPVLIKRGAPLPKDPLIRIEKLIEKLKKQKPTKKKLQKN